MTDQKPTLKASTRHNASSRKRSPTFRTIQHLFKRNSISVTEHGVRVLMDRWTSMFRHIARAMRAQQLLSGEDSLTAMHANPIIEKLSLTTKARARLTMCDPMIEFASKLRANEFYIENPQVSKPSTSVQTSNSLCPKLPRLDDFDSVSTVNDSIHMDIKKFLDRSRLGRRGFVLKAHWLSIEGNQPTCQQNPTSRKDRFPRDVLVKRKNENGRAVKMKANSISMELQLFYISVTEQSLSEDFGDRNRMLQQVEHDPTMSWILPRLIQFIHEGVAYNICSRDCNVLFKLVQLAGALINNPNVDLLEHMSEILASLLSNVVCNQINNEIANPLENDIEWTLRELAAKTIGLLCRKYSVRNRHIQEKARNACIYVLSRSDCYEPLYGSICTLSEMGDHFVLSYLHPRRTDLSRRLEAAVNMQTTRSMKAAICYLKYSQVFGDAYVRKLRQDSLTGSSGVEELLLDKSVGVSLRRIIAKKLEINGFETGKICLLTGELKTSCGNPSEFYAISQSKVFGKDAETNMQHPATVDDCVDGFLSDDSTFTDGDDEIGDGSKD